MEGTFERMTKFRQLIILSRKLINLFEQLRIPPNCKGRKQAFPHQSLINELGWGGHLEGDHPFFIQVQKYLICLKK